jgi:hypothetical protein
LIRRELFRRALSAGRLEGGVSGSTVEGGTHVSRAIEDGTRGVRGRSVVLSALFVCSLVLLLTGPPAATAASPCPNEGFRTGYSATLPDCRAYELVSAGVQPFFETFGGEVNVKLGEPIVGGEKGTFASEVSTSSGLAFFSTFAPPGSTTDGPFYLASRGPGGWSQAENLIPPQQTEVSNTCLPYMADWSANLERGVLADGFTSSTTTCGEDEPEIVPGEPRGAQNLFLRDSSSGSYQLIDQVPVAGASSTAFYEGGSRDLGLVAFAEEAKLTAEAPVGLDYYVWAGGNMDRLLTILPDGQPTEGAIVNAATFGTTELQSPTFTHAIAPNGDRIQFAAKGNLYSRVNPGTAQSAFDEAGKCDEPSKACTIQLDASQTAEPGGGGVFEGSAGEGGEVVLFSDENRLTGDSTAATGEPDLYEYDFSKPVGERLTDLTVDSTPGEHANVLGYVGNNETGSPDDYFYFIATGVLASNTNSAGAGATPGAPNLYLAHGGTSKFIATLSAGEDSCDWEIACMTARVSPNGRYVGFDSVEQLTGFDNLDVQTSQPDQEIFLYEADADSLSCASCGTTGAAPTSPASIRQPEGTAIKVPLPLHLQHNISDSGQVFFDTRSHLLEAARNGVSNVYEYEEHQLHLLSSGTAEAPSYFYEASSDGGDVYLITAQALTPGSNSVELTIFDTKVDGGFPAPSQSISEPCEGESCSGPQTPGAKPPVNATEAFTGPGNLEVSTSLSSAAIKLSKAAVIDGRKRVSVKVTVSSGGKIVVKIMGGRTVTRTVAKAGTYALQLTTTSAERSTLRRHRRLTMSVSYRAADGATARATRTINAQK